MLDCGYTSIKLWLVCMLVENLKSYKIVDIAVFRMYTLFYMDEVIDSFAERFCEVDSCFCGTDGKKQ